MDHQRKILLLLLHFGKLLWTGSFDVADQPISGSEWSRKMLNNWDLELYFTCLVLPLRLPVFLGRLSLPTSYKFLVLISFCVLTLSAQLSQLFGTPRLSSFIRYT